MHTPCNGPNHLDYSANRRYIFILSCELDGRLLKIDLASKKIVGTIELGSKLMPQDVRSSPDGKVFYVADMMANGVHEIDPYAFKKIGFLATGKGTHGFFISRDAKYSC